MIAGHFGFAALAKAHEKAAPLWALMLATVWLDIIFVPLLLAGAGTMEPVRGSHGGYGANIIHADYTHSLVGACMLSAILGVVALYRWGHRAGIVVGAVSFSHWLLDLPVHRGDMPILPGNAGNLPKLGFGLWQLPWAVAAIELVLVVVGGWLYWRAARSAAKAAGRGRRPAVVTSLLILFGGALVLFLDVTQILG
jgi:membrane-bound metal-dependent hydrolase YbcI (DUF457 family)